MKYQNLEKHEYKQLRELLIKYIEHKKERYSWFSTDEILWLIDQIEEDDLNMISDRYEMKY